MWTEITIGILAALGLICQRHFYSKGVVSFWAFALVLAAMIYVAFAAWGKHWNWLPTELAGLLLYGLVAYLAWRYSPWWLVLGWLAHVAWDIGWHAGGYPGFVPHWYPGLCIGFDICVAGYLAWCLGTNKHVN